MFDPRLDRLKQHNNSYWATRLLYQLEYAHELSQLNPKEYESLIEQTITALVHGDGQDGAITRNTAQAAEAILTPLATAAKAYTVICAAHAHIDMNWMWRWDETVAITLDTFRTMLDLMRKYPDFKFSQSQASVYQIVETFALEMLDEIRLRISEGRWEVTAVTWVEGDKNLPNGESQARQLLYTRRYLSRLLDLPPQAFQLDFEPDTFGHHINVPEILASGGVKFYYHCRGDNEHLLYRWQSPSGRSILVYREPLWYLGYIEPTLAINTPSFCQKYGLKSMLKVYGVGDHGGGPTRRDVERIRDMDTWPVFPKIHFGTFSEFFAEVEQIAPQLPTVTSELNFIFTGCYTSQSRIKRANRLAEATLHFAETFSALATLQEKLPYPHETYVSAWQNTLFNQFHDIIPGSGVVDTREFTLGLFQQTLALASSQKTRAFRSLTHQDSAHSQEDVSTSIAGGAGTGFGVTEFKASQVSRGEGKRRLFHIFNPAPWPRRQVVEVVVWDWEGDLSRLAFLDEHDNPLPQQLLDRGWNAYWGHNYLRVLVEAQVPACGYSTLVLTETHAILDSKTFPLDPRTELPVSLVLENETLRATFDSQTCALTSLVDKAGGVELVDPRQPTIFRRIQEDDKVMGTAWVVGRYMDIQPLTHQVQVLKSDFTNPLRKYLTFEIPHNQSKLTVTVALDAHSRQLDVIVDCDWREIGRRNEGVPQLNFIFPLAFPCATYRYDIPFGTIERPALDLDVPANSWGLAVPEKSAHPTVQIVTEGKHGFRGFENALALTLLRSSFDPDPYPEFGQHKIHFAIVVPDHTPTNQILIAAAYNFTHPLEIFSGAGTQPEAFSALALESGSVILSALKAPEDGSADELILRLYETDGQSTRAILRFAWPLIEAAWVDVHEQPLHDEQSSHAEPALEISGQRLVVPLASYALATLRLKFQA